MNYNQARMEIRPVPGGWRLPETCTVDGRTSTTETMFPCRDGSRGAVASMMNRAAEHFAAGTVVELAEYGNAGSLLWSVRDLRSLEDFATYVERAWQIGARARESMRRLREAYGEELDFHWGGNGGAPRRRELR